ncbi:hypothetical protein AMECASPLE_017275, partial [Ameca splendens]
EDSEKYSRSSRMHMLSDDEERMSVGSRGSVRGSSLHKKSKKKKKHKHKDRDRTGCDDEYSVLSGRSSRLSDESRMSQSTRLDLQMTSYAPSDLYGLNDLSSPRNPSVSFNGYQVCIQTNIQTHRCSDCSSSSGWTRLGPASCSSAARSVRSPCSSVVGSAPLIFHQHLTQTCT